MEPTQQSVLGANFYRGPLAASTTETISLDDTNDYVITSLAWATFPSAGQSVLNLKDSSGAIFFALGRDVTADYATSASYWTGEMFLPNSPGFQVEIGPDAGWLSIDGYILAPGTALILPS